MLINAIQNGQPWVLLYMLPILIITLTIHEMCHGLAAHTLGDDTAKSAGRLSLNPLRHIDPAGFIMMLFWGFGWAKPVGVNLNTLEKPKRDFALVSVAGPASNFILGFLFSLLYVSVYYFIKTPVEWLLNACAYAVSINIGLGVFNMLPIPPLDGSRIAAAFLPDRLYIKYLQLSRYGMFVILLIAALGGFSSVISVLIEKVLFAFINAAEVPIRGLYLLINGG